MNTNITHRKMGVLRKNLLQKSATAKVLVQKMLKYWGLVDRKVFIHKQVLTIYNQY